MKVGGFTHASVVIPFTRQRSIRQLIVSHHALFSGNARSCGKSVLKRRVWLLGSFLRLGTLHWIAFKGSLKERALYRGDPIGRHTQFNRPRQPPFAEEFQATFAVLLRGLEPVLVDTLGETTSKPQIQTTSERLWGIFQT